MNMNEFEGLPLIPDNRTKVVMNINRLDDLQLILDYFNQSEKI